MNLRKAAEMALEAWSDPQGMPKLCKALDALREALVKPEQEPVAWIFDKQFLLHEADATTFKESPELYIPLYLHPASATPEGWQLVPKEPTDEMCYEGQEDENCTITNGSSYARALYQAMLAAAPKLEELK